MISLLINLAGLILIFVVLWWFFGYKPRAKQVEGDKIDIIVENGVYTPDVISIQQNKPLFLSFIRNDESPCSEIVMFPDFEISEELPVKETHTIKIPTDKIGEFEFTCQMGMYRGKLMIEA